jgi:hypothetical protein
LKSNGQVLDTNAFLIPRFGGVSIANPPKDLIESVLNNTSERPSDIPLWFLDAQGLQKHMGIYIAQMRGLLGVQQVWTNKPGVLVCFTQFHNASLNTSK